jgi:hypothetical protein
MSKEQEDQITEAWLDASQFAALTDVSGRAARKILSKAVDGSPWRGIKLNVRREVGRGGRAGLRYVVEVTSLPTDLQRQLNLTNSASKCPPDAWAREEREARHAAFARLPTSMQTEAKRRLLAVHHFQSSEGTGMPMLERYAAAAAYAGESASTIRRWLGVCKGVHPGDWSVVLARKHPGNRESAPISRDALEFIKAEYFKLSKPALKPIYRRAQLRATERGWALPSYATVKRTIKAEHRWLHVAMREGSDAAERMYPTQERDYSALKVHEIWCADGRKADVFARWEDGTIGRPIVLGWIDLRSRVCVGYAIDKVEGADVIRRAFRLAMERTLAVPDAALIDNGRGFASKQITGGIPNRFRFKVDEDETPGVLPLLGVKVTWALPFRGRSKPIESFWRQLAEMDRRFPGAYCGNNPDTRPEDCDPGKAVPIAEYRLVLEETLRLYHATPHRGDAMLGRSPHQVYEELLQQTIVRQPTKSQLRICLQAAETVKLNPADRSFRVLDNRYWTKELASIPVGTKVVVRYDPEDAKVPVCVYRGEEFICEAPLIERTGFRDRAAAKEHARANRKFRKSLVEQAGSMKDMRSASRWLTPPAEAPQFDPSAPASELPVPKVVRPLRPIADYRPSARAKSETTPEQMLSVNLGANARRVKGT